MHKGTHFLSGSCSCEWNEDTPLPSSNGGLETQPQNAVCLWNVRSDAVSALHWTCSHDLTLTMQDMGTIDLSVELRLPGALGEVVQRIGMFFK